MEMVNLSLTEAYALAYKVLRGNGFSEANAAVVAKTLPTVSVMAVPRMVCGGCWGLWRPHVKGRCHPTPSQLSPIPRRPL